ncbi:carboxymuconolactone decarboxylase family protein [Arthrobacter sp. FW305-BF8]|uniref:carboxymuconolactone decarboxylase family protein n=1 Tax=Arthrobacter sp. FW305-BF8 TaxID=2879617 RepID=UPI001F17AAF2|nr:carboxymuconolactone decarboxylase family protein [Arthrobacter sp. FW305-BF8]UKA55204.1 carboxymuconolactone decarboxylase family protein [Arthrobacter sp. FW305-BF8]
MGVVKRSLSRRPSEYLRGESVAADDSFKALRTALLESGPLDTMTCELIVISALGIAGFEDSFKTHSARVLETGADIDSLRHAVVVTLGATSGIYQVARALEWLDELESEAES